MRGDSKARIVIRPQAGRTALVIGATGDQGWPQVLRLATAGYCVRAGCRDPNKFDAHRGLPRAIAARVEPVALDFRSKPLLDRALHGVDALLVNFPSSSLHDAAELVAAAENVGASARRARVAIMAFNTSLPLPERSLGFPAQDVRFAQRDALRDSGVPVVSIQPVVYMDNLLRGWTYPGIVERNCFEYPHAPDLEVSWLCQEDLAAYMQAAIEQPHLGGRNFNVGGPEVLRGPLLAHTLSEIAGREIAFRSLPIDEFASRMSRVFERDATLDAARLTRALCDIYEWYNSSPSKPFCVAAAPILAELPVTLTTFETWARRQRWS
jgi:uncharacterized protein YbjT (DUF2867 family)